MGPKLYAPKIEIIDQLLRQEGKMFTYKVPDSWIKITFISLVILALSGCAGHINEGMDKQTRGDTNGGNVTTDAASGPHSTEKALTEKSLSRKRFRPSVEWHPSFKMSKVKVTTGEHSTSFMTVGADIKSVDGKVPLDSVVNKMAKLKNMSVSWASDTDQKVRVSVNIRAKDGFWKTLKKLLEQVDYFYEFHDNTIVIKYKDTRRFYISNPYLVGSYKTSVGGDFLGGATEALASGGNSGGDSSDDDNVHGTLKVDQKNPKFNIWEEIENNINTILDSMTVGHVAAMDRRRIVDECIAKYPEDVKKQQECIHIKDVSAVSQSGQNNQGKTGERQTAGSNINVATQTTVSKDSSSYRKKGFYYTVDKTLGIITVTAPRIILNKIASYIDELNEMLSKQVIIDAKLLEVQLTNDNRMGIDWSNVLKNSKIDFETIAGAAKGANPFVATLYPSQPPTFPDYLPYKNVTNKWSSVNVQRTFSVIVNMLNDFGKVKVLSNPKISLLNGQPGLITGGQTQRIVSRVSSTISTSSSGNTITYDISTQDILSGIGISVVADIDKDDNIILHLTPVNTELLNPDNIEEKRFGSEATGFVMVQLPRIALREMTTMAKVKSGQLIIIGGIISEQSGTEGNKVPVLGDIPFLGYAFKYERKFNIRKELVILLRPQLVSS